MSICLLYLLSCVCMSAHVKYFVVTGGKDWFRIFEPVTTNDVIKFWRIFYLNISVDDVKF